MSRPVSARKGTPVIKTVALGLMLAAALSGCGNKDKKGGQAIVSVNGEEVTMLQLNNELTNLNVPPAQQEAASKQVMEALIDRQLLLEAATKDKMDRSPTVMQAVERARATIIAQAYMQKKLAALPKPTKSDIEAYYKENPIFFAGRKVLEMKQLQLAGKDVNDEVKKMLDTAKTLDEVAAFLTAKGIKFGRNDIARSTSDLPQQMSSKMLEKPDQLFLVNEGQVSTLLQIVNLKDAPVSLEVAAPQIEQFLMSKKQKETSEAEIKRLRSTAKIDYQSGARTGKASAAASASANAVAPAAASAAASSN